MCARGRIGELLEQVDLGAQVVAVEPVAIPEDISVPRRDSALSAWVNVIHGCNERCTYCVVPNTRGVEQSRAPDAIRVRAACIGPFADARRRSPRQVWCARLRNRLVRVQEQSARHGLARCMCGTCMRVQVLGTPRRRAAPTSWRSSSVASRVFQQ